MTQPFQRQPARNPEFPAHAVEIQQRIIALFGRPGAEKIYKFPDVVALAPNTDSQNISLPFRKNGVVAGIYGCTATADPNEQAALGVKILFGGSEGLATDGSSIVFVPLLALVGGAQNWFPLSREVNNGQIWSIQYRNTSGALNITPTVCLAYIELPQ